MPDKINTANNGSRACDQVFLNSEIMNRTKEIKNTFAKVLYLQSVVARTVANGKFLFIIRQSLPLCLKHLSFSFLCPVL